MDKAWSFERALKVRPVEEPINLHWHRRIAYQVLVPFQRARWVTPLRLTLLSGVAGVSSGIVGYRAGTGAPAWFAAGAVLLLASSVLDCADGMLARLRAQASRLGMLLDGLTDYVVGLTVWYGFSHAYCARFPSRFAWPAAISAILSTIVHAALYEHYKGRYLALCESASSATAPPSTAIERALEGARTVLYDRLAAVFVADVHPTTAFPDADTCRQHLALPMQLASWLGLGTHLGVVYLAVAWAAFSPHVLVPACTVAVAIGGNLLMLVVLGVWSRAERRLRSLSALANPGEIASPRFG